MLRCLLLDLDDTLLGNPMDRFIPVYFDALTRWAADEVDPDRLIAELLTATRAMGADDDPATTNEEVFAARFYPALGRDRKELEPVFSSFYAERFPELRRLTERRAEAREIVGWARGRGLDVVIATNPLFPRAAIEERLRWAEVAAEEFDYALVTCYENMHATKSSPAYYREILDRVGHRAEDCLMAGDDWRWDVVNAAAAGIRAWWIAEEDAVPPGPEPALDPVGQGPLGAFWGWLASQAG